LRASRFSLLRCLRVVFIYAAGMQSSVALLAAAAAAAAAGFHPAASPSVQPAVCTSDISTSCPRDTLPDQFSLQVGIGLLCAPFLLPWARIRVS